MTFRLRRFANLCKPLQNKGLDWLANCAESRSFARFRMDFPTQVYKKVYKT